MANELVQRYVKKHVQREELQQIFVNIALKRKKAMTKLVNQVKKKKKKKKMFIWELIFIDMGININQPLKVKLCMYNLFLV